MAIASSNRANPSGSPEPRPDLPELPYAAWEDTLDTLHLFAQIVGKVKLAASHPQNHWWNITFTVDARGLTTRRLNVVGIAFDIAFDFIDHRVVFRTDRGEVREIALVDGLSVAAFDLAVHGVLADLGIDVPLLEKPFGVPHLTTPFREDTGHCTYQAEYAQRFWRVLTWSADVFEEFMGWFDGKSSPVQLFWHSFDLALTRFSGKRVDPPMSGVDPVTAEAYSHEVISFGFWAGDPTVTYPAYYSYAAPKPDGVERQPLSPREAVWLPDGSRSTLEYDVVRLAEDPRRTLLGYLQSNFAASATLAGWPTDELRSNWCPTSEHLRALARAGL
ncbi:DUF5996 family protein [Embleya sp. NPDC055664]